MAVDAMRASLVNQSHFGLPLDFAVMFGNDDFVDLVFDYTV
jgi:hypothetical protein